MDVFHMYAILCGAISDALDALPKTPDTAHGRYILERAIEQTENLYIEAEEQA